MLMEVVCLREALPWPVLQGVVLRSFARCFRSGSPMSQLSFRSCQPPVSRHLLPRELTVLDVPQALRVSSQEQVESIGEMSQEEEDNVWGLWPLVAC